MERTKAASDSDLTQRPAFCGDEAVAALGANHGPFTTPPGGCSTRGARAGHKSTSLRGRGGESGSQGTCCSAPVCTCTAGLHEERARISSEAQTGPQHKDRTEQHSKMTVTSVQTGRVLSLDLLQCGEPRRPPELEAPCPGGGAGVGVSQNHGWCAKGQAPEGGGRARPCRRREAGRRHTPTFRPRRDAARTACTARTARTGGAPATEPHEHTGTRPAGQESTR